MAGSFEQAVQARIAEAAGDPDRPGGLDPVIAAQREAAFRLSAHEHHQAVVVERAAAAADAAKAKAAKFATLAQIAAADAVAAERALAAALEAAEHWAGQAREVPDDMARAVGRQPVTEVRAHLNVASGHGGVPK